MAYTDRWHENLDQLRKVSEVEAAKWKQAWVDGNVSIANTFVGEAVALIRTIESLASIINQTVLQAEKLLHRNWDNGVNKNPV